MSTSMIVALGKDTVITLLLMGAPMLAVGALLGILMSMLQTVTQLKDQSLTTIPKIIGVMAVIIIATPFLIKTIVSFAERIFFMTIELGQNIL